jgi:hypothetical protein
MTSLDRTPAEKVRRRSSSAPRSASDSVHSSVGMFNERVSCTRRIFSSSIHWLGPSPRSSISAASGPVRSATCTGSPKRSRSASMERPR